MEQQKVNEEMNEKAERLYEMYRPHMDIASKGLASIARNDFTKEDVYALGTMHEQVDSMVKYMNEAGANDLGIKPNVMHDAVTLFYSNSIIPLISSVQPISSRRGIVYFEQVRAKASSGNVAAEDVLADPRSQRKTPDNYASAAQEMESLGNGDGATTAFAGSLASSKIQIHTALLYVDGNLVGKDIGPSEGGDPRIGQIVPIDAAGAFGTINYTSGAYALTFLAAPPVGTDNITLSYQIDWEEEVAPRTISMGYESKEIQAEVFALKSRIGMIKSYELSKVFGKSLNEDQMLKSLTNEMNQEIGYKFIRKLFAAAPGAPVQFEKNPTAGVSFFDHKQELADRLAESGSQMAGQAGQGVINCIIAGRELAAIYETLPGFTMLSQGQGIGPQIYGSYKGITLIRVNEDAVLGPRESINLYKGSTFHAPAVFSPFMPITSSGLLPEGQNPLTSHMGAVTVAGVDILVPNFITRLQMTVT